MVFVKVPLTVLEGVCVVVRVIVELIVELRELLNEGVKVFVGYCELLAVFVGV